MNTVISIVMDLKEKKEGKIYYYYSVNELYKNTESAGIFAMDLNVFDEIPENIKDYSLYALNLFLDKRICIIRACQHPMELPDCMDMYGIVSAGHVIKNYKNTEELPEVGCIFDERFVDFLLQNDEFVQVLIKNGILSKERIELYRKENKHKNTCLNEK